jgi:Cu-Zn family superoxide dismutase
MRFASLFVGLSAIAACGGSKPAANAPEAKHTEEPAASKEEPAQPQPQAAKAPEPVEVKLLAKSGSKLAGTARFEQVEGGVKVTLELSGISQGQHGAHIHQKADCSSADAKSAGDHFNPDDHPHGMPTADKKHLGDLGNIEVDKDGNAKLEIVVQGANLEPGDAHSFIDRAIIIHEKKDDGGQPTGNAGGRIGCGEIKR